MTIATLEYPKYRLICDCTMSKIEPAPAVVVVVVVVVVVEVVVVAADVVVVVTKLQL